MPNRRKYITMQFHSTNKSKHLPTRNLISKKSINSLNLFNQNKGYYGKVLDKKSKGFSFRQVLRLGLAPDKGLFMPNAWPRLPSGFFKRLKKQNFKQIAFEVASQFADVPSGQLKNIIDKAFDFPAPLKHLSDNIYVLELFHGPTMSFKDFGARFLSRSLGYFLRTSQAQLNIIVATSGDTGSAVASGFFKIPGIRVFILYPSGKVSPLQEKQLTTYGENITAIEVKGAFDDCQKLVKQVLADSELNQMMKFSSANSINFGRLLPQSFYYFWAYGQLQKALNPHPALSQGERGEQIRPVIVVPSGNFGNLFAGLMAKKMGLPIAKFIAATNSNNIVPNYLNTGKFLPKKSKKTISNAMDVGNPSNFARILELYRGNYKLMAKDIVGLSVSDADTRKTIKAIYKQTGYILDPHTAVGVKAAENYQRKAKSQDPIIVLSTAHPAKFGEIVEPVIGKKLILPKQLKGVMNKKKRSIVVSANYKKLRSILLWQ